MELTTLRVAAHSQRSLGFPQSFEAVEKLGDPGSTGSAVVVLRVSG
jgi:hypothetical protein